MARMLDKPSRVLGLWATLLVVAFSVTIAANVALARYIQQQRSNDPDLNLDNAERLMNTGEMLGAWDEVSKALAKAPQYARTHKVQGDLHFTQKQWKEAVAAYARALDIEASIPGAVANTMWSLIELEQYNEAIRFGQQALQGGQRAPLVSRYISEAYARSGRIGEAVPHLEVALKTYSNDLYLLNLLLQAYTAGGNAAKTRVVRERIDELQSGVEKMGLAPQAP